MLLRARLRVGESEGEGGVGEGEVGGVRMGEGSEIWG